MKAPKKSSPTSTEPASAPLPDWLPFHRAPFHFFPNFAPPGDAQREAMRLLADRCGRERRIVVDVDEKKETVRALKSGLALEICAETGEFWIDEATDDEVPGKVFRSSTMFGPPHLFFSKEVDPLPEYARSVAELTQLASSIWCSLQINFARALQSGRARVMARRKLLEPFQVIAPDQWRFFEPIWTEEDDVIDWGYKVRQAKAPSGDVLYSPHIAPSGSQNFSLLQGRRAACVAWATAEIEKSPDLRTITNKQIIEQARQRWSPDFPKPEILRCLNRAKSAVIPNSWNKPGRPKKSPAE